MLTIFELMQAPPYYVIHDDEGYWLVPVREQGWLEREPFVGRVADLKRVVASPQIDLGLPLKG